MNEKIKELSEIADEISLAEFNDISLRKFRLYREIYDEKFAELIIQECVKIVDDCMIEAATSLPENYLGESLLISMKITDVAWKIKQHFGVEE